MREPAKLIQGGSTPSGTFILQLPEQTSKDVIAKVIECTDFIKR